MTSTEDFSAYVNAKFRGLVFNPDGTKMLVISKGSNKKVNEFRLSTGFDLTTASYVANYDITSYETDPHGVAFNNDGSTMYILGTTGDDVNEFTLPYAYSLVLPPTITVTAPNGGETLTGGSTTTITWTSVNISANVKIEYSKDGFSSDTNTIVASTTDDGSYDWTIPNDPSSTVTVRISDASDASINDVSDADITILSGLSIDENTIESMRIYPNPTKGMIYIETVDTEKIISVKLYDLLGKVIMVSETNNTVDLKYLPSGIYFIKIKTQNNHIVRRIIKD